MKLSTHYINSLDLTDSEIVNWRENFINDSLYYSYRNTQYDKGTYPSSLHYHEYYELIIFVNGDIRYICESSSYTPACGDIILIPPGKLHMSKINCDNTQYQRHVFYFYPDAFDSLDCSALLAFADLSGDGFYLALPDESARKELLALLGRLDALLKGDGALERAAAVGVIIQIFYLLNQKYVLPEDTQYLPKPVVDIQNYIDANYQTISSVLDIADHFFYSREYVSRLFKQHFNTTISDYIRKRRIVVAQRLISRGVPLTEICYRVGFTNLSTFIRAFRNETGITPSAYRSRLKKTH